MEITEKIEKIEELIQTSKHIPMSSSVVVSEKKILDLLDELRLSLPEELKEARWIVKERQEIINDGKQESERNVAEARVKSESLIAETEVVKEAKRQATEIVEEARNRAKKIRLEAEDYVDEKLANLEVTLDQLIATIQKGREKLHGKLEIEG